MDILVITVSQRSTQLAFFRFGVSIHALSILEQLDFEEGKPISQDGSPMDDMEIEEIKKLGAVIPRTTIIDAATFLQLISMMDPMKDAEDTQDSAQAVKEKRGNMFVVQRKVMEGAIKAIANEDDISVMLALMPVIDEFHDHEGNPFPNEDDAV